MNELDHAGLEAAADVFCNNGIDISLPWLGDMDDLERERFNAMCAAITAYLSASTDAYRAGLEAAAKVADALAEDQRATNKANPEHVKAYPAWEAYVWKYEQVAAAIRALPSPPQAGETQ